MSILNDLALFIHLTERISPRCRKSLLWRRTRDRLLKKAVRADLLTRDSDEYEDDRFAEMDAEYERSIAGKSPRELLEEALGWPLGYKK